MLLRVFWLILRFYAEQVPPINLGTYVSQFNSFKHSSKSHKLKNPLPHVSQVDWEDCVKDVAFPPPPPPPPEEFVELVSSKRHLPSWQI